MGARVLRAAGAVCLAMGLVLAMSAGAWSLGGALDLDEGRASEESRATDGHDRDKKEAGRDGARPAHGDSGHDDEGESGHGGKGDEGHGDDEGESGHGHDEAASAAGAGTRVESDDVVRDASITRTCERILGKAPTGGLEMTTEPAGGSTVAPGDRIEVRITWDPAGWLGNSLHKTIDCVSVNGAFALERSAEDRPATNDGEFTAAFTVPAGAAAGDEVCAQGFASGDGSADGSDGGFAQERSNQVCFTVAEGSQASQPGTDIPAMPAVPASPAAPPPVAAGAGTPAPSVTTDVLGEQLAAPSPARAPAEAGPAAAASPAPEVAGATLPRTGAEARRGALLAGGVVLMLGGLGLMAGNSGRRREQATG